MGKLGKVRASERKIEDIKECKEYIMICKSNIILLQRQMDEQKLRERQLKNKLKRLS